MTSCWQLRKPASASVRGEIPRWQRVPEHLTAATRSKYGCVAISLFALEIRPLGDNSNDPATGLRGGKGQRVKNTPAMPCGSLSPPLWRKLLPGREQTTKHSNAAPRSLRPDDDPAVRFARWRDVHGIAQLGDEIDRAFRLQLKATLSSTQCRSVIQSDPL